ncbi:MAG: FHA domain-containing protein [Myxococcales bacterium]|nr:FHA domain-containing protein [Myxococcales bacterium]
MTRTRRTVEISDALWDALELMSREMSVDRDSLMNQALFTFARFNGYVTPGAVAPHARPAPGPTATAVPPVAQPLASPPSAVRRDQDAAPPPSAQPEPERAQEADDNQPRMATGSVAAVTSAHTAPQPALADPSPATDPNAKVTPSEPSPTPPSANAAPIADPAPTPPSPAPAGVVDDAEPPEDEELDDGLEALPENGAVEWKVPRHILADPAVTLVKGTVKGRDFQGAVQQFDASGNLLHRLELGAAIDDARIESVLVHEVREPKAWKQLSQELAKENHIGEATLALVRAVGAGDLVQTLTTWLSQHTIARKERAARERAQNASFVLSNMNRFGAPPPRKAAYLVEELLQGAFPATILRELAIDQDQYASSRAAADLIRCAKAIDSADKPFYAYTQALIEMSLGNPDASRVCADELRERSEEQADFLTTYLNGLFPEWSFWPSKDPISNIELEVEAVPSARTLADFRNAIQKTALRFKSLQEKLETLVPAETKWLPPSVETLLARGKVTLSDDETLEVEEWQEKSLPQLLRFAHNEWARLTWLCWLAGLDAVSLPSATSKPRSPSVVGRALALRRQLFMAKAEDAAIEEAFEANDLDDARLVSTLAWLDTTAGEVDGANASELGVPEVDAILAAFSWATDAEVASPFGVEAGENEEEQEEGEEEAAEQDGADEPEADDAAENVAEQPATEAAPVGLEEKPALGGDEDPAAQDDAPPEEDDINDPPPADRTNIVRPSGRTIWIQRDGHDTLELSGMRLSVGRDPKCEIVIASPRVSREHAAILVDADTVLITDLNSSNGTFFNGERIMKHTVNDGDVVQFGNEKVTFRFTDPG